MFLQSSIVFASKNLSKTLRKRRPKPSRIDVENRLFFSIGFLGVRPRFWSLLGLQVRRAAVGSPGVLEPTAFYACIKYCSNYLRGGQGVPRPSHMEVQTPHVGVMLALCPHIWRSRAGRRPLLAILVAFSSLLGFLGRWGFWSSLELFIATCSAAVRAQHMESTSPKTCIVCTIFVEFFRLFLSSIS